MGSGSLKNYFEELVLSMKEKGIRGSFQRVLDEPAVVFSVKGKYHQQGRYQRGAWNPEEAARVLARFFQEDQSLFLDYFTEIEDKDWYGQLKQNADSSKYREFPEEIGYRRLIYAIVRYKKPGEMVETGVFDGFGTTFILGAMEENSNGRLYSLDLETSGMQLPPSKEIGWMIPEELRDRWVLEEGRSAVVLPRLLEKTKEPEIFLHDSLHSYDNMTVEYQRFRDKNPEGVIVSDDTDRHSAFEDFARRNDYFWKKYKEIGIMESKDKR